jgi:hypothetical protein
MHIHIGGFQEIRDELLLLSHGPIIFFSGKYAKYLTGGGVDVVG